MLGGLESWYVICRNFFVFFQTFLFHKSKFVLSSKLLAWMSCHKITFELIAGETNKIVDHISLFYLFQLSSNIPSSSSEIGMTYTDKHIDTHLFCKEITKCLKWDSHFCHLYAWAFEQWVIHCPYQYLLLFSCYVNKWMLTHLYVHSFCLFYWVWIKI